jgi:wyosine [tRNA(Phe)-imidazoG37] synthetase (radical SAM superfamily)
MTPNVHVETALGRKTRAYRSHPTQYGNFRYVYPVVSRRVGGLSFGINLTPDQRCNFHCVYCQVHRKEQLPVHRVDVSLLEDELWKLIEEYHYGRLFENDPFCSLPADLLVLKDLAFSGDGEPTTCTAFEEVCERVARIKRQMLGPGVKLLLITNATRLNRRSVEQGLQVLDAHQGEIWAKLDAGTEDYYREVNRAAVPFNQILKNIECAGRKRALCIQTMFMRVRGESPSMHEVEEYTHRLNELLQHGCLIKQALIYTVAREPAEEWVQPLSTLELESIARRVQSATGLEVRCYPS